MSTNLAIVKRLGGAVAKGPTWQVSDSGHLCHFPVLVSGDPVVPGIAKLVVLGNGGVGTG
jgi:hypothetical protein